MTMSNPQHLAEQTMKTGIIEAMYASTFGKNTPDHNGRYRAEVES